MLLVCYPTCTTCRRARKWLEAEGISFTERNIREERPDRAELEAWYRRSGLPLRRWFNTSGLRYKELGLKEKLPAMDEAAQLALLASDGMLVRRPLLIDGDTVLVGFREAEWASRLRPRR